MSKGWLAGEYIAAGIDQAAAGIREKASAQRHLNDVRELVAQRDALIAERNEVYSTNGANFAEKHALRVALAKFDPNHPLITNKALQEKVQEAGMRTLVLTNNDWNAVAIAGQTFKY
jgi:hypothetical protein